MLRCHKKKRHDEDQAQESQSGNPALPIGRGRPITVALRREPEVGLAAHCSSPTARRRRACKRLCARINRIVEASAIQAMDCQSASYMIAQVEGPEEKIAYMCVPQKGAKFIMPRSS